MNASGAGEDPAKLVHVDIAAHWCRVIGVEASVDEADERVGGELDIGGHRLEYRHVGPDPTEAATIVMLHEGLGSVGLWGDFPDALFDQSRRLADVSDGLTAIVKDAKSGDDNANACPE